MGAWEQVLEWFAVACLRCECCAARVGQLEQNIAALRAAVGTSPQAPPSGEPKADQRGAASKVDQQGAGKKADQQGAAPGKRSKRSRRKKDL